MQEVRHLIQCLGLNHKTAPINLREKLAFTPHRLDTCLARIGCGDVPEYENIRELVILSTCNRVELYAVSGTSGFEVLEHFLADVQEIDPSDQPGSFYRLENSEAVNHLFRVAAGLDSAVLGEAQILGQVADAYTSARAHGTSGKVLSRLFQSAIRAGKRARSETAIGEKPASIASVAVNLISDKVSDLAMAQVMVLGAGEMAEIAVEALRKRGVEQIVVVNRTKKSAQELASRWNGQAAALEMLLDHLKDSDIVITSTGAPHTIIQASMVEHAMRERADQPLVFMDIAVPRDVDEDVGDIPGVSVYDIDLLSDQLETSLTQRQAEVPHVQAILDEEQRYFFDELATMDILPTIVEIRQRANQIRQAEFDKTLRRLPELPEGSEEQIEALTRSIVNKILHDPTTTLKEQANGSDSLEFARVARSLFGLE